MSEEKKVEVKPSKDIPVSGRPVLTNEEIDNLKIACIRTAKEEKTADHEMAYLLNLSMKLEQMKKN